MDKEDKKLSLFLLIVGIVIFIGIFLIPYLLTRDVFNISYMETGQVGDTFGGITAPFIGGIGVLLTFAAFYIQYIANKEQRESLQEQQKQLEQQEKDLKIERFENKFFELIKIYRENVAELTISSNFESMKSKKLFIPMFNEFRICYYTTKNTNKIFGKDILTENDLVNISFNLFYIGIGENSNVLLNELLSRYNKELISEIIIALTELKKESMRTTSPTMKNPNGGGKKYYVFSNIKTNGLVDINEVKLYYKPFCGHISRLGHYFRHIWMMINFLEKQDPKIFSEDTKKEYAKMFRAQVSNYEQLILHYNALTDLGKVWFEKGLITKYKLTKNLPYPMAYFGPNLKELYGEGYFEWEEALKKD